jgi:replication-associated recombination protein RarA
MPCLPEGMEAKRYYFPTRRGIEERISKRLEEIRKRRAELRYAKGT